MQVIFISEIFILEKLLSRVFILGKLVLLILIFVVFILVVLIFRIFISRIEIYCPEIIVSMILSIVCANLLYYI